MKTAFIKIRNRSTLSLMIDDQDFQELDNAEMSLEKSLDRILSEENIPSLGEGWRKEIVRRSPEEAVIICVKTPGNVELRSVLEAKEYLHKVGIKDVDVEKLFSSPPTPSKNLQNEVVEQEVIHKCKETSPEKSVKGVQTHLKEGNLLSVKNEVMSVSILVSECDSEKNKENCKSVQSVSENAEPDSVAASSDTDTATTTTDCSEKVEDRSVENMPKVAVGDLNDNRDVDKREVPLPKFSKKRKLVQTNMFAFLGQGHSNKKVKLNDQKENPLAKTSSPTSNDATGKVLLTGTNVLDHTPILEKVSEELTYGLDSNSNVQETESKCLLEDDSSPTENSILEVLEKVPEHPNMQELVPKKLPSHAEVDEKGSDPGNNNEKSKNGYYECKSCDYKTKKKADLTKHQNRRHVKCTDCNYSCPTGISLELHMFYIHGDGAELVFNSDKSGHFRCEQCDCVIKTLPNLKQHVYSKHSHKLEEQDSSNGNEDEDDGHVKSDEDTLIENEDINQAVEDGLLGEEKKCEIEDHEDEIVEPKTSSIDDEVQEESIPRNNAILLDSSDLPDGWTRLKVPRQEIGKFDKYVQAPEGKRFNCQKKVDLYIAHKQLKVKVNFRGSEGGTKDAAKKPKPNKQPCKESGNIPEVRSKTLQEPALLSKRIKKKIVDKENKEVKKEKKPKVEVTDMFATDKEMDELEGLEELTQNELDYIAEIDQFMKETNLPLEPTPATKGDGNCWYRAAACQVVFHQIPHKPRNHKSMRLEVCNHLKNLPDQVKEDTINVLYQGKSTGLSSLASRQRKDGQWVDNTGVMVMATALYLERNIHLYGYPTGSETQSRLFSLTKIEGGDQADEHPPLTVFYYDRHYQTLQPAEPMQAIQPADAEAQKPAVTEEAPEHSESEQTVQRDETPLPVPVEVEQTLQPPDNPPPVDPHIEDQQKSSD